MRRTTSRRPLLAIAVLAVGGILWFGQPYLTAAVGGTAIAQVGAAISPLSTPQQSAPSPLRLPTLTPQLLRLPTVTPTRLFLVTPAPPTPPEPTPTQGPPPSTLTVVPAALLYCTRQGEKFACYDQLLAMDFRYPAFMGELNFIRLRPGGYDGFIYGYMFAGGEGGAGGVSRDFSEGTDAISIERMKGFDGRSPTTICAEEPDALCQVLGPGAVLMALMPQSELLCSRPPGFIEIPYGVVVLDLPEHPLINGFAFSFSLLPPAMKKEFTDQWYAPFQRAYPGSCTPAMQAELRTYIESLRLDLLAGTAPAEIQQRYDALLELAKSIQSPYIVTNPQSP